MDKIQNSIRKATVCYLVQDGKVLLALIEYKPGDQKWTGIGGMVDEGEMLDDTVLREVEEETYLRFNKEDLKKVAEINGYFQLNVFITHSFSGEIKVKEPSLKELKWFSIHALPSPMHPDTDKWLPKILEGKLIKITGDTIKEVEKL